MRVAGAIGRVVRRFADEIEHDRVIARAEKTREVTRALMRRRTRTLQPGQVNRPRHHRQALAAPVAVVEIIQHGPEVRPMAAIVPIQLHGNIDVADPRDGIRDAMDRIRMGHGANDGDAVEHRCQPRQPRRSQEQPPSRAPDVRQIELLSFWAALSGDRRGARARHLAGLSLPSSSSPLSLPSRAHAPRATPANPPGDRRGRAAPAPAAARSAPARG